MSFTLNLFRQVAAENEGNLFVSPASILSAMAIATAGTDGNTEAELSTVLGLEGAYETKHASLGSTSQLLQTDYLSLANRIYVNDNYDLKPEFANFAREVYDVQVSGLDVSDPENEAARVNRWVEKKTNGKIKDIVNAGMIDPDFYAFIINAIAYKGNWKNKFDKKQTFDVAWTLPNDGGVTEVPRMHKLFDEIPYKRGDNFHSIALDLEGDVSMVLVLPTKEFSLDEVIASITEEEIASVTTAWNQEVMVGLAKWQFGGTYKLVDTFKELGVRDAFDEVNANFSRMTDQSISISDIIHKTFIKVDEEGAEMAAATVVVCRMESCAAAPPEFITDQPFIYFAVDKNTKTILFAGRVSDPRQTE